MRFYETMFIVRPTLNEEEIKSKIEIIKNILLSDSTIEASIDMGMRNLAYEIKKQKRGYYYVFYFKSSPLLIKELERNYRIDEDILRFIIIKYENKTEQKNWQTLVDKANGKIVDSKAIKPKEKTQNEKELEDKANISFESSESKEEKPQENVQ